MTKLSYQSYGSSILLFIEGETQEEAYGKYLSIWNWNGTSSEPDYITDFIICVWTTQERLLRYFFNQRVTELIAKSPKKGVPGGVAPEALELAKQDFAALEHDIYRSCNGNFDIAEFGTISAEKPDEDLRDYFVTKAFQAS